MDLKLSSSESSDSDADKVCSNMLKDGDDLPKSNVRLRLPKPVGVDVKTGKKVKTNNLYIYRVMLVLSKVMVHYG